MTSSAMQYLMCMKKVFTGKANGTELDPNGNALRAECATIIQRYIENQEI